VKKGMVARKEGEEEREDEKGWELELCEVANGQVGEITL